MSKVDPAGTRDLDFGNIFVWANVVVKHTEKRVFRTRVIQCGPTRGLGTFCQNPWYSVPVR